MKNGFFGTLKSFCQRQGGCSNCKLKLLFSCMLHQKPCFWNIKKLKDYFPDISYQALDEVVVICKEKSKNACEGCSFHDGHIGLINKCYFKLNEPKDWKREALEKALSGS